MPLTRQTVNFCDIPAVLPLACGDTSLAQKVGFTNVGLLSLICFALILLSYTRTGISISKIRSAEGRQRAFSTCSAHITAILCAYGPVIIIYLQPNPSALLSEIIQILNNLVTPMLNPLIYSLRNKDVKSALRSAFHKRGFAMEKKWENLQLCWAKFEFLFLRTNSHLQIPRYWDKFKNICLFPVSLCFIMKDD